MSQCRSNTWLNADESRCDADDMKDFNGTSGEHTNFLRAFYTLLGCASCTSISIHTQADTLLCNSTEGANVRQADTDKLTNTHQCLPFGTIHCLAILPFFSVSLSLSHTNTQSLRWGNWMWQQILRGLLAGYQVNLWNGTHLTPAGWLWHLQRHGWLTPAKTGG